jgi:hypothetical protein
MAIYPDGHQVPHGERYFGGAPDDDTGGIPEPVSDLEDRRRPWKARRQRVALKRYWARVRARREALGQAELTHVLDGARS